MTIITRSIVCLLLLLELPAMATAADTMAAGKPNIIFIFVDDQGYYDLGCYGATEVKTPHIDAMARGGMRFTDYYAAAPICSPSRAGLLTGCYPRRVGMEVWVQRADSRHGIHPDELTLAELLQSNGYATACIGKWHLGFQEPFLPGQQGFDHYFGLLHNLDPVEVVHFEDQGGVPLMRNGDVVKRPADPAELTKVYTDEAIQFIEQNREEPFFLYLPHTMLHNPLGVSEAFKGSSNWGEYGDAIQELDHNVGRIFDTLKRLGIDDNTIVVYASDNGRGPGRTPQQPIRGRKLSTYEGGIRVPAIAWGPGLAVQAGAESSAVVRAMDWYPTLATLAGIRVPAGRVIDGRDISPLLKGETHIVPPPGMKNIAQRVGPAQASLGSARRMGALDRSQRIQQRVFLSRQPGCAGRGPLAQLETLFESEPPACTIFQKIPRNRNGYAIRKSLASCAAWQSCSRRKCGSTHGRQGRFHRHLAPTAAARNQT